MVEATQEPNLKEKEIKEIVQPNEEVKKKKKKKNKKN
jgi:hypothetical protein